MTPSPTVGTDMHQVLIAELHHRFYNSLQVISSLAGGMMRVDFTPDACRRAAEDIQGRVAVLAQLHRMLSKPHGAAIERSCRSLCRILATAFAREDTKFGMTFEPRQMEPGEAQGLMLLLAELVTNAMKHMRSEAALRIDIHLSMHRSGYDLSVSSDSAPPCGCCIREPRIASQLARKLGGTLRTEVGRSYVVLVSVPTPLDQMRP